MPPGSDGTQRSTAIALPVSEEQSAWIKQVAELAPFGRGEQTVVDAAIRHTWQLAPDQFELRNPGVCVCVCTRSDREHRARTRQRWRRNQLLSGTAVGCPERLCFTRAWSPLAVCKWTCLGLGCLFAAWQMVLDQTLEGVVEQLGVSSTCNVEAQLYKVCT